MHLRLQTSHQILLLYGLTTYTYLNTIYYLIFNNETTYLV